MQKTEVWAIPAQRILDFFQSQPDVRSLCFRSCRISVTELPHQKLGRLQIPQTQVAFEGEAEDVSAIYRRFFMRFLSAGG